MSSAAAAALAPEDITALAERVAVFRRKAGVPQSWLARRVDVSVTAVSQFESGSYKGDNAALALKLQALIEREELRERGRAHVPFCRTSTARAVRPIAEAVQMENVVGAITGRPGCGKTTVLEQYAADNPGSCFYVVATIASASPKGILGEICQALRLTTGGTLVEQERRIVRATAGTSRMGIIDDAHYVSDRGLLALQGVHERARVPMLLVGNPWVLDRVFGGRSGEPRFVHWASRILFRHQLVDEIPRHDVQMLARAIFHEVTEELVDHCHRIAQGIHGLRGVVSICRTAQRLATAQGRGGVTVEDLVEAEAFQWGAQ